MPPRMFVSVIIIVTALSGAAWLVAADSERVAVSSIRTGPTSYDRPWSSTVATASSSGTLTVGASGSSSDARGPHRSPTALTKQQSLRRKEYIEQRKRFRIFRGKKNNVIRDLPKKTVRSRSTNPPRRSHQSVSRRSQGQKLSHILQDLQHSFSRGSQGQKSTQNFQDLPQSFFRGSQIQKSTNTPRRSQQSVSRGSKKEESSSRATSEFQTGTASGSRSDRKVAYANGGRMDTSESRAVMSNRTFSDVGADSSPARTRRRLLIVPRVPNRRPLLKNRKKVKVVVLKKTPLPANGLSEVYRDDILNGLISEEYPSLQPAPGIDGFPGIDYPIYSRVPETRFQCWNQRYWGMYADTETQCQVWHYCDRDGSRHSFLCPNGTVFSQVTFICDWWYNVDCNTASQLYVTNEALSLLPAPPDRTFPEDFNGPIVDWYIFQRHQEKAYRKSKFLKLISEGVKQKSIRFLDTHDLPPWFSDRDRKLYTKLKELERMSKRHMRKQKHQPVKKALNTYSPRLR